MYLRLCQTNPKAPARGHRKVERGGAPLLLPHCRIALKLIWIRLSGSFSSSLSLSSAAPVQLSESSEPAAWMRAYERRVGGWEEAAYLKTFSSARQMWAISTRGLQFQVGEHCSITFGNRRSIRKYLQNGLCWVFYFVFFSPHFKVWKCEILWAGILVPLLLCRCVKTAAGELWTSRDEPCSRKLLTASLILTIFLVPSDDLPSS